MPRTRAQRAQQFQSFDALTGFRELIREQEKVIVEPRHLTEEECDELDRVIVQVQKGMMVRIVYFESGNFIQLEGIVSKINLQTRMLQIVKKKINFKQLYEIKIVVT